MKKSNYRKYTPAVYYMTKLKSHHILELHNVRLLTSNEKVTTNNKDDSDRCQHKASSISVVFIAHETNAAH